MTYTFFNSKQNPHIMSKKKFILNEQDDIDDVKENAIDWIENMLQYVSSESTKAGSLQHLFYGEQISHQSVNIKLGHFGEFLLKELVKTRHQLQLFQSGITRVNNRSRDIDFLFLDTSQNPQILYYREIKGNIELDSEKTRATIEKCIEIASHLASLYPSFKLDTGILNWSIYKRGDLAPSLAKNIKTFEKENVKVEHMADFLEIIKLDWPEDDFYLFFRELGDRIKSKYK